MAVVGTFTGRDHRILVRRLGLDGDDPSTLDELGREFGVTRERIRQLESKLRPELKMRLRTAHLRSAAALDQGDNIGRRPRPAVRLGHGAVPTAPAAVRQVEAESRAAPDAVVAQAPAAIASQPESGLRAEAETPSSDKVMRPADWERARHLAGTPSDETAWLAEYALSALGHAELAVLLGQAGADAAVRCACREECNDRDLAKALGALRHVLDALVTTEMRPEDFLDRQAEALVGVTPREYLARKPLVHSESRLALRDALREFVSDLPPARQSGDERPDTAVDEAVLTESSAEVPAADDRALVESAPPGETTEQAAGGAQEFATDDVVAVDPETPPVEEAGPAPSPRAEPAGEAAAVDDAEVPEGDNWARDESEVRAHDGQEAVRRAFEEREIRLREQYEQRLSEVQRAFDARLREERQVAEGRLEAARMQAERELDALEDALLHRVDEALARRERNVRAEAEERTERLKQEHREAYEEALRRAEHAEEAAQYADFYRQRANEADLRLRQYREHAEARIAGLEERLSQTEAALAERDTFVQAARRHAEAVEHNAAQRIAQSEHDAWVRISELQEQLAAAQQPDGGRASFRNRWSRS
jgi:RNA polymerase primary sigma factor